MKKSLLLAAVALALTASPAFAIDFKATKDWVRLPDVNSRPTNLHGDVAIASNGDVYVSTMDAARGVQVFSQDGKYLRDVPNAPNDFHGFVIRKDKDGEFIYGPRLVAGTIVKLTLDGKTVLEIPSSAIPDEFKILTPPTKKNAKGEMVPDSDGNKRVVRLTGMDVAPNGDLYVTDGYSSDYIHRFDRTGKYLTSFGGKKEPYNFKTLHKIAVDTRFAPARIIVVDREGRRLVHLSLDGEFLGVIAKDLLRPAAVAVHGDYAAVGEILGQVTIFDKEGKVVAKFGTNSVPEETANNKMGPDKWRAGIFNAPHGVAFNSKGDIFVSEYNTFGRIHRFDKK